MDTGTKCRLRRIGLATGIAIVIVLATVAGLGMLVSAAPAATPIYVRTDGSDGSCNGTVDVAYSAGVAPNCAVATINQGISLVDAGGTVIVAAGTYVENVSTAKDVTLQGAGAGSTIIDAGGSWNGIYVYNATADVAISGFTIQNAGGTTGVGIRLVGGSALTLTDSTVSDNTGCSACNGAGLYMPGSSGGATAVISNCTFSNNAPGGSGADGGAISNQGGRLTVVNSSFVGNHAQGRGGAIHSANANNSLVVIDSVFSSNTVTGTDTPGGGAIWFDTGSMVISNTTFLNNWAGYDGGGVAISGGTARIHSSLFASNRSVDVDACYGGAIYNYQSTLLIEDSVFRDNWVSGTGSLGGGIFSDGSTTLNRVTVSSNWSSHRSGGVHSQDPLTMTNVTLSGNSAYDTAGGMMHTSTAASVLNNCTIISNTLSSGSPFGGGGLQLYGPTYMTNTLLADNDLANCGILGSNGSLNSGGDNLEDGDSCNLVATGDMTSTDPQITSLAAFGPLVGAPGSQERMSLHAVGRSSPAIDAITKATCPSVDQRGVSRPVDGDGDTTAACDIGAFEFDLLNAVFLPLAVRND